MADKKRLTILVPNDKHKELKLVATSRETTMTDIVMECVEKVIQDWKKEQKKTDL